MNRTLAILLAMAIMLAHSLAIHLDSAGHLGPPYDFAHRAFHLARNWIQEGSLVWNTQLEGPARGGLDSYPSPLWVMVASLAERLYLPVTRFVQVLGIALALMTVRYSVMFDRDRISSVIPALLLVTSGAFAAAAPCGMEYSMVAFLMAAAFGSFEHGRRGPFGVYLCLLVLARPEGVLALVLFAAFSLRDSLRRVRNKDLEMTGGAYLPGLAAVALMLWVRNRAGGSLYGTWIAQMLTSDATTCHQGLNALLDLATSAVTPVLVLFPIMAWVTGPLTRTGRRALAWALCWITLVVMQGGGNLPFSLAFVPALPMLAIAIQQGILAALDTDIRAFERLSWAALFSTCLLGLLATKTPASLMTLREKAPTLQAMSVRRGPTPLGVDPLLGRASVLDQMDRTKELRNFARFLQERIHGDYSILSTDLGAISYLSGLQVLDLYGQVTAPDSAALGEPWDPSPPVDLLATLDQEPDFILPGLLSLRGTARSPLGLGLQDLLARDGALDNSVRLDKIRQALGAYELVVVPIHPLRSRHSSPFAFLRRKDLGLTPRLELNQDGQRIRVDLHSDWPSDSKAWKGHPQLARLAIEGTDEAGGTWRADPRGVWAQDTDRFARPNLRILPAPDRTIRLAELPLQNTPTGTTIVSLRAWLVNPVLRQNLPFAPASPVTTLVVE